MSTEITDNALHAAATWLERMGAAPTAVAVVTVHPVAGVGLWQAGWPNVRMLPEIDDSGAELCEAAAPAVRHSLADVLAPTQCAAVADAIAGGARLQLLLIPEAGELVLRLVQEPGCVVLCALTREPHALH